MFPFCTIVSSLAKHGILVHSDMQEYYKAQVWALLPSIEVLQSLFDLFVHNRAAPTPDGRVLFTDVR